MKNGMSTLNSAAMSVTARRNVDLRFMELMDKVHRNRPGEPYLSHPVEVAHLLADMKLDATSICAALLHDVVEDTKIPQTKIAELFGPDIERLVEGVTK